VNGDITETASLCEMMLIFDVRPQICLNNLWFKPSGGAGRR